jgi:hypothetical protein
MKRFLPIALALCGIVVWPSSSSAVPGAAPGWELSASTSPTNLTPGGVNEVQRVTPNAAETTFTLTFGEQTTAAIPTGSTASVVRAALDALSSVGAGDVEVAESAGTYEVTFVKLLGNMRVARLEVSGGGSVSVPTLGAASGTISVSVFNIGAANATGTFTLTDTLPPGVKAKEAGDLVLRSPFRGPENFGTDPTFEPKVWDCTGNGPGAPPSVEGATVVTCENDPFNLPVFAGGGGIPTLNPNEDLANPQPRVGIAVEASGEVADLKNKVSISGGGAAAPASTENTVTVSKNPARGGLSSTDVWLSNANGTVDTQAGTHPYEATSVFNVATALRGEREGYIPGNEIRDLETKIPPGLIGDLHSLPQCRQNELITEECPPNSMVGNLALETFFFPLQHHVFNIVPPEGHPAELGFVLENTDVLIQFSVQTGSNDAVVSRVHNIKQGTEASQMILTLWGVPADESHNPWRGRSGGCTQKEIEEPRLNGEVDYCARQQHPVLQPILTLPTSCTVPQEFVSLQLSGWQEPLATSESRSFTHNANDEPAGFGGCEALESDTTISATPDNLRADSPTGLNVELRPSLGGLEEPYGVASAQLKNVTVTLPEGLVINPDQAAGLEACGPSEDALTTQTEREHGEENTNAPACKPNSKVGTVIIKSPLIEGAAEKQIEGNVYLLQSNPPELKLLIGASADGVNLKLPGTVHANEQTGRLETTFTENPQLPFSDFKLTFKGGPQASLATPAQCGLYTTNADFTPWSSPFTADTLATPQFAINEGVGGAACPSSPLPLGPSFSAGAGVDRAGAFTSFSTLLQREDGQQRIEKLQLETPKGLAAMIASVPVCPEPQAQMGTCPAASRIGHNIVSSGPGPYPLTLPQAGEPEAPIYLTGPYQGAPFGLSIVTPVIAGPFNLGTNVTRARIQIDPHTAQVTITTDPFPQILNGVPTNLRTIESVIERPGFMFNPTNCEGQQIAGTVWGAAPPGVSEPGRTAAIASRFALEACRDLSFNPRMSVSTTGQASKKNGAGLTVKIALPHAGPQNGSSQSAEANIRSVHVELPKALPSRLSTLQKACTEKAFDANPASCPPESIVGHAVAHTPILPVPLEGPAYFVSHGGAKFPELVMVLQGDGVTIQLNGETSISKAGITASTFASVPDAPVSSFELALPQGRYSALAGIGNLCQQKLVMPTAFVAQNGATLDQNTRIEVEGCSNALSVVSKSVKGRTLTLKILVPGAGKLTASGKGVGKASKSTGGREEVKLTLHGAKGGKTKLELSFSPKSGKRQTKTITVKLGK